MAVRSIVADRQVGANFLRELADIIAEEKKERDRAAESASRLKRPKAKGKGNRVGKKNRKKSGTIRKKSVWLVGIGETKKTGSHGNQA